MSGWGKASAPVMANGWGKAGDKGYGKKAAGGEVPKGNGKAQYKMANGEVCYQGQVLRFNAERQSGFIACGEVFQQCGTDTYIFQDLLKNAGAGPGDTVGFFLHLSAKSGQAQASVPVIRMAAAGDQFALKGTFKPAAPSPKGERNYGFVQSETTTEYFGRDVFCGEEHFQNLVPDQTVAFNIFLDKNGKPKVSALMPCEDTWEPVPADLSMSYEAPEGSVQTSAEKASKGCGKGKGGDNGKGKSGFAPAYDQWAQPISKGHGFSLPKGNGKGGTPGGEACQFFAAKGWCKWGDACKHQHIGEAQAPATFGHFPGKGHGGAPVAQQTSGTSGESCQFFAAKGWCKFGDMCKHQHVGVTVDAEPSQGKGGFPVASPQSSGEPCSFFTNQGWCKWGDMCKHQHIGAPAPAQAGVTVGFGKGHSVMPPTTQQSTSGEACQFFTAKGWCKWGDMCKHQHVADAGAVAPVAGGQGKGKGGAPMAPSGEACQFFTSKGWCKWGDMCKHQHVAGAVAAVADGQGMEGMEGMEYTMEGMEGMEYTMEGMEGYPAA